MTKSVENNTTVELEQYREKKFNVLVPTTHMQQISPFHKMRIEEVRVDPNPDNGEVFKVGSKKVGNSWQNVLSPAKPAIMKLANAAGIVWNWNETRVLAANRDYVLYQAVGAIRKPSGEWIPLKATKEIDLVVIEEETLESNLKKADGLKEDKLNGLTKQKWAEQQTRSNMIQWRKNKVMRAETGAMLRVVRALLNLKMQYSPQELQNPFIVPRVDFSPDYTDPEVRRMVQEQGVKATTELFGAAASQSQGLPPEQMMNQAMGATTEAFATHDMGQPIDADDLPKKENIEENIKTDEENPPESLFNQDETQEGGLLCDDCGVVLSDKVANYSLDNFGAPLCVDCQNKRRKAGK